MNKRRRHQTPTRVFNHNLAAQHNEQIVTSPPPKKKNRNRTSALLACSQSRTRYIPFSYKHLQSSFSKQKYFQKALPASYRRQKHQLTTFYYRPTSSKHTIHQCLTSIPPAFPQRQTHQLTTLHQRPALDQPSSTTAQ